MPTIEWANTLVATMVVCVHSMVTESMRLSASDRDSDNQSVEFAQLGAIQTIRISASKPQTDKHTVDRKLQFIVRLGHCCRKPPEVLAPCPSRFCLLTA